MEQMDILSPGKSLYGHKKWDQNQDSKKCVKEDIFLAEPRATQKGVLPY